jgi:hypothetical protein
MDVRAAGALILGSCVCLGADAQSLFKCVQGDGKVVYQDSRCPDEAKQSTVRPPDAPADRRPSAEAPAEAKVDGAKTAAAPPSQVDVSAVVEIISSYEGCADDFPAFAAKYGAAYQQWKSRNQTAVTRYGQDGAARRRVMEALEIQRRMSRNEDAAGRAEKSDRCDKVVGPLVEGKAAQR